MAFEKELQAYRDNLLKLLSEAHRLEINPFRGLEFFDFEQAPFFHGRTKAIEGVLDVLQQQVAAKKPFILVLGPEGSGKTSLVKAGILPVLTQTGITGGNGSWRLALTRPTGGGPGDPFDALATALLKESALPEFPDAGTRNGWQNLAAELREAPENAALRLRETLQYLSVQALDHLLDEQQIEVPLPNSEASVELPRRNRLGRVESGVQLALVVDELEDLFVAGFAPELQQRYIAALGALVKWRVVFGIALLRSDFYTAFQECCRLKDSAILNQPELSVRNIDLIEVLTGRFDLHPPSPQEVAEMIRMPAESVGLRFELDPETGRSLDAALLKAATTDPQPLPLLEHILCQLYRRRLPRKDGLIRWSDYRELGEFEGALPNHAESVFLALDGDAQAALKPVIRQLVYFGLGEGGGFIRRTVSYRDLVSSPEFSAHRKAGAGRLIDQFVKEGLFHSETGADGEVLVRVTQECLLRKWPRVRQLLNEDVELLRTRDRLESGFKLWLSGGHRGRDLLRTRSGVHEAKALLRSFRASLSEAQIDYLRKSLKAQNRRRWVRSAAILAAVAGLLAPVIIAGIQWLSADVERKAEQSSGPGGRIAQSADAKPESFDVEQSRPENAAQLPQGNAAFATRERDALQARLRDAEARAQQIQNGLELATSQRDALRAQLKDTEAKAQQVQKDAVLAASQRDALQIQLKDTEAKVQKKVELVTSQRDALQSQLKDTETRAQQVQKDAALATSQRDALQGQLKELTQKDAELPADQRDALQTQLRDAKAGAQQIQKSLELVTTQRDALQNQLKESEAKAQEAQKNVELVTSQRDALQGQLKETEAKAQQAQKNADLSTSQRDALQGQLKDTEAKAQQAQKDVEAVTSQRDALQGHLKDLEAEAQQAALAAGQRDALQSQLKDSEAKAQQAQMHLKLVSSQRDALQGQLKDTEAKAQQAQKNAELATSQRDALQGQLKDTEAKAQQAQKNAELATSQRDALQGQLRDTEAKAHQAQKNAELATSQRDALQGQLRDTEAKAQQAQKNAELATSQRDALQGQLKDTEAKAQQAQKDVEVAANQPDTPQTQQKPAEEAQRSHQNAEGALDQSQPQQDQQSAKSDLVPMGVSTAAEGGNEETTTPPKRTHGSPSGPVRHQRTHHAQEVRSPRTSPGPTKAAAPLTLRQLAQQWNRLWQKLRGSETNQNAPAR
jgi:hypothetical protein